MKVQDFLAYHGIEKNPFAEEDAQTDPVFQHHCIESSYHPAWDKIFGDPSVPATSIVFGEKGAGKTAMRLQIDRHLDEYNRKHTDGQLFVIHYDDFNPFLDRFVNRMPSRRRRPDKALAAWRLWDHMDAILGIGITKLLDGILEGKGRSLDLSRLDRHQKRDLLLLAACYDQSTTESFLVRWSSLRKKLHFPAMKTKLPFVSGVIGSLIGIGGAIFLFFANWLSKEPSPALVDLWNRTPWWVYLLIVAIGWLPFAYVALARTIKAAGIYRSNKVGNRTVSQLRKVLSRLTGNDLASQPIPNKDRTDDRYELLCKLQGILETLGYKGIVVLVDRVDEPHLINGSPDLMKALIWPMLDNKFLKHQGLGVKLMLPSELKYFVEREDRDFVQRARLDKQNMVPSLAWTGEALFDVVNDRLKACALDGKTPSIRDFFDDALTKEKMIEAFRTLRVPRHLHKFLYHLLVAHCNAHTDDMPSWKVTKDMFENELSMFRREMDAAQI